MRLAVCWLAASACAPSQPRPDTGRLVVRNVLLEGPCRPLVSVSDLVAVGKGAFSEMVRDLCSPVALQPRHVPWRICLRAVRGALGMSCA